MSEKDSIYQTSDKFYVFVVCGVKVHIDTLHHSLKSFKKNTKLPQIVITDSSRNEIAIQHEYVIDIKTPKHFDHHQASIFLKTSLHRYLPKGKMYVYMDSDILAIGKNCDAIFKEYIPPIRFGADHCIMPAFSPAAVHCGCQESYDKLMQSIKDYVVQFDYCKTTNDEKILKQRDILKRRLLFIMGNKKEFLKTGIRAFFSWPIFQLDKDYKFNRKNKIWYNTDDQPIMTQVNWRKVSKKFGFRYNIFSNTIKDKKGRSIWISQCDHLQAYINNKFDIKVKNANWQHWNGGVFLFGDTSHSFLNTWHELTMEIFNDPLWKTRDQGTLIATAWKYNLQKHPTLNEKWNYICDDNNKLFGYREADGAITKNQKKYSFPDFVHIYHRYGDNTWDFWNWINQEFKDKC